ncbi:AraC family transcriptional regulator [Paractinoplanes rishiriensis]|uniref:AraC family transcriptional regulator n=1 Tax=Paractinoplanes rishiriensis TaxID=1050105 RepID=A0A919K8Z6_9ACTN|nr:AraC family transcriptional regulator [Actinoplanes rishiriensis]GIE98786.1 AraC family transcriptional regulator [Actinoplanes rishiriensis]
MDVLSDVLTVLRTGRPRSALLTWHAPWAQEFAAVPGAAGFHVVLRGRCWLTRPGEAPLALQAGDVVFRPHGPAHTLSDDPSTRPVTAACHPAPDGPLFAVDEIGTPAGTGVTVTLCGAYELDPVLVHPLLLDLPDLIHVRAAHLPAADLLAAELERPRLGTDALVPALLETLLLYLLRAALDGHPGATGWPGALRDRPTAAALAAMHRDPARPWTVAALAAEARMSRATFARRFTALVGQPPLTYLTWWRLTTAARLLRRDDAPLAVVAKAAGYTSEFAFAAAFKRQHGIAPGRYRLSA